MSKQLDGPLIEQRRVHYIYAVALQDEPGIYVTHTVVNKKGKFYQKHTRGAHGATVGIAAAAGEKGQHLSLYLLEEYLTDNDMDAYHRCIAWQRLAREAGYTLLSAADNRHVDSMNDAEQAHYEALRNEDFLALCSVERDLAPGIIANQRGPRDSTAPHTVRVEVPGATYQALRRIGRERGLNVGELLLANTERMEDIERTVEAMPNLAEVAALRLQLTRYLSLMQAAVMYREVNMFTETELMLSRNMIDSGLTAITEFLSELQRERRTQQSKKDSGRR